MVPAQRPRPIHCCCCQLPHPRLQPKYPLIVGRSSLPCIIATLRRPKPSSAGLDVQSIKPDSMRLHFAASPPATYIWCHTAGSIYRLHVLPFPNASGECCVVEPKTYHLQGLRNLTTYVHCCPHSRDMDDVGPLCVWACCTARPCCCCP
jgi:hypothetical protein